MTAALLFVAFAPPVVESPSVRDGMYDVRTLEVVAGQAFLLDRGGWVGLAEVTDGGVRLRRGTEEGAWFGKFDLAFDRKLHIGNREYLTVSPTGDPGSVRVRHEASNVHDRLNALFGVSVGR